MEERLGLGSCPDQVPPSSVTKIVVILVALQYRPLLGAVAGGIVALQLGLGGLVILLIFRLWLAPLLAVRTDVAQKDGGLAAVGLYSVLDGVLWVKAHWFVWLVFSLP
jgi:hypothetical protein